jgi:hypothetical protein
VDEVKRIRNTLTSGESLFSKSEKGIILYTCARGRSGYTGRPSRGRSSPWSERKGERSCAHHEGKQHVYQEDRKGSERYRKSKEAEVQLQEEQKCQLGYIRISAESLKEALEVGTTVDVTEAYKELILKMVKFKSGTHIMHDGETIVH